ncbi:MAG: YjjG family noncanonical pyrimidine nucleotidase [Eubacteriales bacterium]|nr:YjjG family noncanonical pyrimidine nucleotidase [Eubacteriales bacterium]
MKYDTLLLDADGTLLDFEKAEARGLEAALKLHQIPFDNRILAVYSRINKSCWEEFEQGLMTKETLLVERFRRLFKTLGITGADPQKVRLTYNEELSKGAYLIDGAFEVCQKLSKTHNLYIVTNGVSYTQRRRLGDSGLNRLVKGVFISEDIGFQKPRREYFEAVFSEIPGFDRTKALLVGDSLSADIQGGINAGIDTCWYNPWRIARPADMKITYEIHAISELSKIAYL